VLKIKIFHNKYYKLLVLAGFIWGFYPLIFNQSLLYLSVLSLLAGRFLVGSIILFIRNQKNRLFHYRRPDKKIITYSLFASIVPLSFFTVGLSLTTPLHASLLSLFIYWQRFSLRTRFIKKLFLAVH
jgi:drug/metabolite transporter (DMT)-like permease